jgi:hypothetical protein
MARLTYSIFEGRLTGFLNGELIQIHAVSGGGSGAWGGPTADRLSNNPYLTHVKQKLGITRGGAIPVGTYTIQMPFLVGEHCRAYLRPDKPLPNQRGGFLIHGRGVLGSDGCIVPLFASPSLALGSSEEKNAYWKSFDEFMEKLRKDGGGRLVVVESETGDRFA